MGWWNRQELAQLDRIERLLRVIHTMETQDMATKAEVLAALTAQGEEIAQLTSVVDSVESVIDFLIAQNADLQRQLAEAIAANDPALLNDVLAQLGTNNAALAEQKRQLAEKAVQSPA